MSLQFDPLFNIFYIIIIFIVIIAYFYLSKKRILKLNFIFQVLSSVLILLLLLNPILKIKTKNYNKNKILLLLDSSESMLVKLNPNETRLQKGISVIDKLEKILKTNYSDNISIEKKYFGSEIFDLNNSAIKIQPFSDITNVIDKKLNYSDKNLKQIFIISDCNFKNLYNLNNIISDFKKLNIKLNFVNINNSDTEKKNIQDISVNIVETPKIIQDNDTFILKVNVSNKNITKKTNRNIKLFINNKLIEQRNIQLNNDNKINTIKFDIKLKNKGEKLISVEIPSLKDEINILNNKAQTIINYEEKQYKILMACDRLSWDYTFLNRICKKINSAEITYFYEPTDKQLTVKPYNLIIFYNFDGNKLSSKNKNIFNQIFKNNPSIFLFSGPDGFRNSFFPEDIKNSFNITSTNFVQGEFKVNINSNYGNLIPTGDWDKLPPLSGINNLTGINKNNIIISTKNENLPILISKEINNEKKYFIFTGIGFYKWLFNSKAFGLSTEFIEDCFRNIVLYCLKKNNFHNISCELLTKKSYINYPTKLSFFSNRNKNIKIEIIDISTNSIVKKTNINLNKSEKKIFNYIPEHYGNYKIQISSDNSIIKTFLINVDYNENEKNETVYSKNQLTKASNKTGGFFYHYSNINNIKNNKIKYSNNEYITLSYYLTKNIFYFIFLFIFLVTEWLIYKMSE